ncbi:MAG: fumarylacetoacetate hydrolase family protein [Fimbriimonadaceae bacterium]|nr:fumarylacetoacetate hydrolase family protein [Fimbriimonadaceae bacterium]
MKLCRFELETSPGLVRSGLLHEGKVYETDGERAIGIHELSSVQLVCPLGRPPALTLFSLETGPGGEVRPVYDYGHPGGLVGSGAGLVLGDGTDGWSLEARIAAAVTADGREIDEGEAAGFVLGFSLLITLLPPFGLDGLERRTGASHDSGAALGPFLCTPDELEGGGPPEFELLINGATIAQGLIPPVSMPDRLIPLASRRRMVMAGEVIAGPPIPLPDLDAGPLGRFLAPTDRINFRVTGLGALTAVIE